MNALFASLRLSNASDISRLMAGPVLILMMLAMMMLPLHPFFLDLFFTINITLSIMVLLVAMFTKKPLDFVAFPSVLLFSTLLRLSLNVASTRVILMDGHNGADAAGHVIEAFATFLVGGNFAVGLVVFAILVLINFIVITKGAGRIAEVGARFTLDAMPGKQMAIDADLNAGLIDEGEARRRRREVGQEAEFYGAMDGASKFVRGDAIAGLIIMFVAMFGGMIVGVAQHGLSMAEAAKTYTLLTIGDGLVGQIPALVISTAAGAVVSRVANEQDVGQQLLGQLFSNATVLYITGGIIGLMGAIPGMPHVAFLLLAAACVWLGRRIQRKTEMSAVAEAQDPEKQQIAENAQEASWDDVTMVEPLALEVGYRLIPLVDSANDDPELLHRIRALRKKFAQNVGFLPPIVHIRDELLELKPTEYRIMLFGVESGRGNAYPGKCLAIDPGGVIMKMAGEETKDPTFGLPAIWIAEEMREQAQVAGYTVVDASTVIATHINHLIHRQSATLFGRQEVQRLLERIEKESPKITDDLVPKTLSMNALHAVLRGLLEDDVAIRDMRTIVETISGVAPRLAAASPSGMGPDVNEMIACVRCGLGRAITQSIFGDERVCKVIGLDTKLERVLTQALTSNGGMEPGLAERLLAETGVAMQRQELEDVAPVLVVPAALRPIMARYFRTPYPDLVVLANSEIPDDRVIKVTVVVGNNT